MLIKILHQKLTLGRSVYQRGDIFECGEQEARMMDALRVGQIVPAGAATREPPLPPVGFSMRGPVVARLPTRARRIASAHAGE